MPRSTAPLTFGENMINIGSINNPATAARIRRIRQDIGAAPSGSSRIAVGILGQSNERGQVLQTDAAANPQAFASLRIPGVASPLAGVVSIQSTSTGPYGAPWFKFFDDLWDWGYEAVMFNGSVGSMSMIQHVAGQVVTRANTTAYASRRQAVDREDMGYIGDMTVQSGKLFLCTTGRDKYAVRRAPYRAGVNTGIGQKYDFIATVGSQASAGADPGTWAGTALGGAVTDGSVVWTNIDDTNSVGFINGQVLNENQSGLGFDPLGLCERLHMNMQALQGVAARHIILCNAQGDAGATSGNYSAALQHVGNFFLRRGYVVWLGLSCYGPALTTGQYDTLTTGLNSAISTLQGGTWGSRVRAGANLYQLMGSTGNMGSGGAFMQGDNLHLTGPGSIEHGRHWADVFKSALPKLS